MIAQGAEDLILPLPGEHPSVVRTQWWYRAGQGPQEGAGEASALEDIGAMRGKSRKEGIFVQDFKKVQG